MEDDREGRKTVRGRGEQRKTVRKELSGDYKIRTSNVVPTDL